MSLLSIFLENEATILLTHKHIFIEEYSKVKRHLQWLVANSFLIKVILKFELIN